MRCVADIYPGGKLVFFLQAIRKFSIGQFILEYAGDHIEIDRAKILEVEYSLDKSKGSFMYYFKHREKWHW